MIALKRKDNMNIIVLIELLLWLLVGIITVLSGVKKVNVKSYLLCWFCLILELLARLKA